MPGFPSSSKTISVITFSSVHSCVLCGNMCFRVEVTEAAREPPGVEVTGGGEPDMGTGQHMQPISRAACTLRSPEPSLQPILSLFSKQATSGNSSHQARRGGTICKLSTQEAEAGDCPQFGYIRIARRHGAMCVNTHFAFY